MRAPGRKSRSKSLEGGEDRKTFKLDHAHKTAGRSLYSQARARLFFVEQQACEVWVDPRPVGYSGFPQGTTPYCVTLTAPKVIAIKNAQ